MEENKLDNRKPKKVLTDQEKLKRAEQAKIYQDKYKQSRRCNICNVGFISPYAERNHMNSNLHNKRVAQQAAQHNAQHNAPNQQ